MQGPIFFVVLDTGEDKEDSHKAYSGLNAFDSYRDEQTSWLKEVIQRDDFRHAPFRVVLTHIPLYGPGKDHGSIDSQKKWGQLLNDGKIDLHLSGHIHRPSVTEPQAGVHDYPIFVGGGPHIDQFTVIRVDADENTMNVTMADSQGNSIGQKNLKRR